MKKILCCFILLLIFYLPSFARAKYQGYAERGGKDVKTSTTVTYELMETFPLSTITVYLAGTLTIAPIFSDDIGTVRANPFTADTNAYFFFYADDGLYDIKFSGTGIAVPFTRTNVLAQSVISSALLLTQDQKDALAGTFGLPSAINKFVTEADPRLLGVDLYWENVITEHNGSGSSTTTTTTGTNSLGATTINVSSSTTFIAGHGILIVGAGTAGVDYIGTISSVPNSTSVIVTPSISTTVSAGTLVQHDDTAAIQNAIQEVFDNGGGVVFLPKGFYRVNRAVNPTTNSILYLPDNGSSNPPITFWFKGEFNFFTSGNAPSTNGTIIQTDRVVGTGTVPSVIAARAWANTSSSMTFFNYVVPIIENIGFRTGSNTTLSVINMHNAVDLIMREVQIDPGVIYTAVVEPTTVGSTAIHAPGINNHAKVLLENVSLYGFYNALKFSEHLTVTNFIASSCKVGLIPEGGYRPNQGNMVLETIPTPFDFSQTFGGQFVNINFHVNLERDEGVAWNSFVAGREVYDPTNIGHGKLSYKLTIGGSGNTDKLLSRTGATSLDCVNIWKGNLHSTGIQIDSINDTSEGSDPYILFQNTNSSAVVTHRNSIQSLASAGNATSDLHIAANAYFLRPTAVWTRANTAMPSWNLYMAPSLGYVAFRRTAAGAGNITWSNDIWRLDGNTTAGETPLLIYDNTAGSAKRVSIGAADSCGAGFRCLRIPN